MLRYFCEKHKDMQREARQKFVTSFNTKILHSILFDSSKTFINKYVLLFHDGVEMNYAVQVKFCNSINFNSEVFLDDRELL